MKKIFVSVTFTVFICAAWCQKKDTIVIDKKDTIILPQFDTLSLKDDFVHDTLYNPLVGIIDTILYCRYSLNPAGTLVATCLYQNLLREVQQKWITRKLVNNRYVYRDWSGHILACRYYINKYGYQLPM